MIDLSNFQEILNTIPHREPFRFIDSITELSNEHCIGTYHFKKDEFFYSGHFPQLPITPSVILIECMAQIGLIPLGMKNLASLDPMVDFDAIKPIFTNSDIKVGAPVYPETTVTVESKNIYFRLNRLKTKVKMRNDRGEVCCSGTLSGIFLPNESITF
ncbi:MAG: hydroxymyristoyl-ACP dehydratase [bacterium]|nr:hydroxymyristoyl-ACP dehydratase [bacterium]